ncbi:uncharacterized protein LOC121731082 [Aricia agestis]|uniref:uncharacterized protein LOC121731082 n=1 Tax=Aricia agestis TaxID=91739 RepID=UPI001C206D79|nr:uncharacterized protein LOC121731082 [Aricia agestis]
MKSSLSKQVLICLMLYASCAQAIMVKFGTKGGPIEPPTPEPLPKPQPYRSPAPVWEARSDDLPDPNAQWRPQLFFPQPRYTQVVFNPSTLAPVQNNAQRFVNAYRPSPKPARPVSEYVNPSQFLSSQSLPGFGTRYFLPAYVNDFQFRKEERNQEEVKHNNDIETNNISDSTQDAASDLLWKFEKESSKRQQRQTWEGTGRPVYQWPVYVHPRH